MAYQDVRAGGHHYRLLVEASPDSADQWTVMAIRDGEIWFEKFGLPSEVEARRFVHQWAVDDARDPKHHCGPGCSDWKLGA